VEPPMEMFKSFVRLPKLQRLSWLVLLLLGVALAGLGIITIKDATSILQGMTHLPTWQKLAWTIFVAAGIGMVGISATSLEKQSREADFAQVASKLESLSTRMGQLEALLPAAMSQLDLLSRKLDLLMLAVGSKRVEIGNLDLPRPSPEQRVGWVDAMTETASAPSISDLDTVKIEKMFEVIVEPSALVNAVLDGRATIKRIVLDSAPVKGLSRGDHQVLIEILNETSSDLLVNIPRGQVFENADRSHRVQNLAMSTASKIRCKYGKITIAKLPAYCLNLDKDLPSGQLGNITPLKVKFAFADQQQLWDRIKEIKNG
jgi:hypothetical protein